MRINSYRAWFTVGLVAVGFGSGVPLQAQSLRWLSTLGNDQYSWAYGVSADGCTVVGISYNSNTRKNSAFRWTPQTGIQPLGTLGGDESGAFAVSWDGRVIVGWARTSSGSVRAFRWEDGTMFSLGTLPGGSTSSATAVSANGDIVAGWAINSAGWGRAFIWRRETGMIDLGVPSGALESYAWGISPDGSVVVGRAYYNTAQQFPRAFRSTEEGLVDLGTLGGSRSDAYGASLGGQVIVGGSFNRSSWYHTFRWEGGAWQDLGTLGGESSFASAVTPDGNIVVGTAENLYISPRAFRWTPETGMQDLNTVYSALLSDGSRLEVARAVSLDGRYIAGEGWCAQRRRVEGFLLDTWRFGDTNGDGCVDDTDLLAILFAFGTSGTLPTRHEDINKDGIVDDADLLIVLFQFGEGC